MGKARCIAGGVAALAAVGTIAAGIAYGPQIFTAASVSRVSSYRGSYNLYEMTVGYDYDLDKILEANLHDDQAYVDAVLAQVLPGVPLKVKAPEFACSAFRAQLTNGEVVMGRNYDFKIDTSALLVRNNPKNGYASIGFSALSNLKANDADGSLKSRLAALLGPFAPLDGVNEKGVSIAVLTLDSPATDQRTGKPAVNTSLAIRLVLDRAATTQEAVDLLKRYDMHAMAGRDYHFFISDATGDSRVVEYDPKVDDRRLVVTPVREVTNYYALYADEVSPNRKNGELGHGKERACAIAAVLDANEGSMTCDVAWQALRAAAQEPNPEDITSNTQWSVVFNNTDLTAEVCLRRNWDDKFEFDIGDIPERRGLHRSRD